MDFCLRGTCLLPVLLSIAEPFSELPVRQWIEHTGKISGMFLFGLTVWQRMVTS